MDIQLKRSWIKNIDNLIESALMMVTTTKLLIKAVKKLMKIFLPKQSVELNWLILTMFECVLFPVFV